MIFPCNMPAHREWAVYRQHLHANKRIKLLKIPNPIHPYMHIVIAACQHVSHANRLAGVDLSAFLSTQ